MNSLIILTISFTVQDQKYLRNIKNINIFTLNIILVAIALLIADYFQVFTIFISFIHFTFTTFILVLCEQNYLCNIKKS